jgi:hypothetical protein
MNNLFKNIKYLFILLICASCVDQEQQNVQESNEVNFSVSMAGEITSRASGTSWEAGDEVGVYMVPAMENATDTADFSTYAPESVNVPYRVAAAGASASLTAVSNAIKYPADGSDVNFIAYYPYSDDKNTITAAGVYKVDVANQSIDLLYHRDTMSYNGNSGSVPLKFKHQLSKLIINLTLASGVRADLSTVNASLSGFPTKVDFNLSTGTFGTPSMDEGEVVVLTPVTITADSAEYTCESIIVPNEDSTGRVITFNIYGATYSYYLASSTEFKSGEEYIYNFEFTGTAIALSGVAINDWTDGETKYGFSLNKTVFQLGCRSSDNIIIVLTNSPTPIAITSVTTSVNADGTGGPDPRIELNTESISDGVLLFDTGRSVTATTGYILLTVDGKTIPVTVSCSACD